MSRISLLAALAVATMPFHPRAAESLFDDRIVAKGKNVEVKQSQIEDAFTSFKATRAASGQAVPPAASEAITTQILDKLIATQIFMSRATPQDVTAGTEAAEKFVNDLIAAAPSEEVFKRRLLAQGSNAEDFRKQVVEQYIVKTVIDRELSSQVKVSETAIKDFYDKNINAFTEPARVRVAHVLLGLRDFVSRKDLSPADKLKKRELAERVAARAKAGEDFTKLVMEFTDDRESKEKNGEYTVVKGMSRIPAEFEAAAFTLKTGQISDVVSSPFGYHVIKCLEHVPAKTAPLAQVQDKIRETLFSQEAQKLVQAHVKKLREEYEVKVDLP